MSKKIEAIQGLKAAGFIAVLLEHCGLYPGAGEWGVSFFLITSGFCIMINHYDDTDKIDTKAYILKKVKPIIPLHILMIAVMLPIAISASTQSSGIGVQSPIMWGIKVLLDVLALQSWIPFYKFWSAINVPSWYLSVYFFCLVISGSAVYKLKKISVKKNFFLIILFLYMVQTAVFYGTSDFFIGHSWYSLIWFTYRFPLMRAVDFLLGVTLGGLYRQMLHSDNTTFLTIIYTLTEIVLFTVVLILVRKWNMIPIEWGKRSSVFAPINVLMVWVFSQEKGVLSHVFKNKFFQYIGSNGLQYFLIHYFFVDVLKSFIKPLWLVAALTFMIIILVSEIYKRKFFPRISGRFINR